MRLTAAAIAIAAGACAGGDGGALGGEEPCSPPEPPAHGLPYADPERFPATLCEPGALADVDVDGVWVVFDEHPNGVTFRGTTRFGEWCGGRGATGGAYLEQTDDHVFWYTEADRTAYKACRVEEDGSLRGYVARCVFEPCLPLTFRARRFGRAAGEGEADGLELVASWDGPPDAPWPPTWDRWSLGRAVNVRVRDQLAYVVGKAALHMVDVSDPSSPRDLGRFEGRSDSFNDVKIVDAPPHRYALLASDTLGVVVVDVTVPEDPREVRRFSPNAGERLGGVHTLFVEAVGDRTYAYFAGGTVPILTVYDVTDPARPTAVSQYFSPSGRVFHDLYVEGRVAYINATQSGLLVVDLSDPDDPRLLGQALDGQGYSHSNWVTVADGRKVSVHGDEGYGSLVSIVDVDPSSPEFMQTIGELRRRPEVSVHNILALGERAYVAWYQDGLRVLDLSDPTDPREIAYYNTWDPARAHGWHFEGAMGVDVDPDRGLVYVADSLSGLVILRELR